MNHVQIEGAKVTMTLAKCLQCLQNNNNALINEYSNKLLETEDIIISIQCGSPIISTEDILELLSSIKDLRKILQNCKV